MGMDPLLGSAIVTGVGTLANSLIGSNLGMAQSEKLMRLQAELNQTAIDNQNRYNHPASQMARLRSAHLNPNLVYGNGQVVGNTADAAKVSPVNRTVPFDTGLTEAISQYQQMRQIDQSVYESRQRMRESISRARKLDAETLSQLSDNKWKDATLETRIEETKQKLANQILAGDKIAEETNNLKIVAGNLVEEGKLLAARSNLTEEQARTEIVRRRLIGAQTETEKMKPAYFKKLTEKIAEEIPYIKAGTDLRELAYRIQETTFNATGAGDQWLADHPSVAVIVSLLEKALGLGGKAMEFVP